MCVCACVCEWATEYLAKEFCFSFTLPLNKWHVHTFATSLYEIYLCVCVGVFVCTRLRAFDCDCVCVSAFVCECVCVSVWSGLSANTIGLGFRRNSWHVQSKLIRLSRNATVFGVTTPEVIHATGNHRRVCMCLLCVCVCLVCCAVLMCLSPDFRPVLPVYLGCFSTIGVQILLYVCGKLIIQGKTVARRRRM